MAGFYLREKKIDDLYNQDVEKNENKMSKAEDVKDGKREIMEFSKQQLTTLVLENIKGINSYAEDIENIDQPLESEKGRGVIEGGYTVVRFRANEMLFAGTDKLHSCIGVSFHDVTQKIVLISHFRILTKVTEAFADFGKILKEKKCQVLTVRLFGGIKNDHWDSNELLQNIMMELYNLSTSFTIIISSIDVIDRVKDYRELKWENTKAQGGDFTIGFALNVESGKVLFQKNAHMNDCHHFDAEVIRCGIFSKYAKRAEIYLALHAYWPTTANSLNLEYDSDVPNFDEIYEKKYIEHSLVPIAKNLLNKLAEDQYCTRNVDIEQPLMEFMKQQLDRWLEQYRRDTARDVSATMHLLEYMTYTKYHSIFSEESSPHSEEQIKKLFVNWLFELGEIQKWCLDMVETQIADEVAKLCSLKVKIDIKSLIIQLKQVCSPNCLLVDWINYKNLQDNIMSGIQITNRQDYLVYTLQNALESDKDIKETLMNWRKIFISNAIVNCIVKFIKGEYNKKFRELYKSIVKDFLLMWLADKNVSELQRHSYPKANTYAKLKALSEQMAAVIQTRMSSRWFYLCPCVSFLSEHIQAQLIELLNAWEKEVLNNNVNLSEIVVKKADTIKQHSKQEKDENNNDESSEEDNALEIIVVKADTMEQHSKQEKDGNNNDESSEEDNEEEQQLLQKRRETTLKILN